MLSIKLPSEIEQQFREVVKKSYHGDIQVAITTFLKLHEKYGWKEQLREDVEAIRTEVRQQGGITQETIEDAITTYRKRHVSSHA
jgi:hypothetical protein